MNDSGPRIPDGERPSRGPLRTPGRGAGTGRASVPSRAIPKDTWRAESVV